MDSLCYFSSKLTLSLEIHLMSMRWSCHSSRGEGVLLPGLMKALEGRFHLKGAVGSRVNSADAEKFVANKGTAGQLPCCCQVLREPWQHPRVVPWQTNVIPRGKGDVLIPAVLVYLPSAQSALISQPSLSPESLQLLPQCPLLGAPRASGGDGTPMSSWETAPWGLPRGAI